MELRESLRGLLEALADRLLDIQQLYLQPAISAPHMPNSLHSIFPPPPPTNSPLIGWTLRDLIPYRVCLEDIQSLFKLKNFTFWIYNITYPSYSIPFSNLRLSGKHSVGLKISISSKDLVRYAVRVTGMEGSGRRFWMFCGAFWEDEGIAGEFAGASAIAHAACVWGGGGVDSACVGQDGGDMVHGLRDTLRTLGKTCPNLETLGAYIHVNADLEATSVEDILPVPTNTVHSHDNDDRKDKPPYFQHLTTLDFGTSPLKDYETPYERGEMLAYPSAPAYDDPVDATIHLLRHIDTYTKTGMIISGYLPNYIHLKAEAGWSDQSGAGRGSAYMKRMRKGGKEEWVWVWVCGVVCQPRHE